MTQCALLWKAVRLSRGDCRVYLMPLLATLASLGVSSLLASNYDECEVDECITVVAELLEACPEGWTCVENLDGLSDDSLGCWNALTAMRDAPVTGPFGEQRTSGPHTGLDIGVPTGTPVYAAKSGEVVELADGLPEGDRSTSNGNFVRINYDDGTQGVFIHLKSVSVNEFEQVTAGQQVGLSNDTGSSSNPHLHYEAYTSQTGDRESEDPQSIHSDC